MKPIGPLATARGLAALLILASMALAEAPRITPTDRMTRPHLKASHDDAARHQKARHDLPGLTGRHDYRAILHAHADDSAHTGGTRPEMLDDARVAGVNAILLTDHHRPPRDFINDSWRGVRDGVLFIPGSEDRGFLLYPTRSILARMSEPTPAFIDLVRNDGGLILLSHIEERPTHPMTGLDGMEIYNRHHDAKNDVAGILSIIFRLTDPAALDELKECLKLYPDELFAAQVEYPTAYLAKWDRETKTRRLTGVAANDCHHNQVLLVKMVDSETVLVGTNVDRDDQMRTVSARLRPGIRALTSGHKPGEILARLDFDPYRRSFRNVSTHILATDLTEPSIRSALRDGHAYVSHDWICDPTGFRFEMLPTGSSPALLMGDETQFAPGQTLVASFPTACRFRLLNGGEVIVDRSGDRLEHRVKGPGVYRVEAWLDLDGESRGWIYSNPIYLR